MFSTTARRVSDHTDPQINARIRQETEAHLRETAAGGRSAIQHRLQELDEEWDIERWVETLAPSFTLLGLSLGLVKDRRWFLLPIVVQSFFLQHAIHGWCPPIPILRRLSVRTTQEIEHERCCLKHHLATLCDDEPYLRNEIDWHAAHMQYATSQ